MKYTYLLPAAILSIPVSAQQVLDLDEIVMSAGLTPVKASAYGRAASVITAEDIERKGVRYAAEALRALPGVSVSRTGSFGGFTQVRIRGNEGNHTLVLIDGVEVAAPSGSEYDFGGLLAADIERIEVLRGAQSSLYGSNAIGGVISITTKRATRPGFAGQAEIEFGSRGNDGGLLAMRYAGERGDLSVSLAQRNTGGFDVSDSVGGNDDEDENTTFNANGRFFINDSVMLGGTLRSVNRDSDFDGFAFGALTKSALIFEQDNTNEMDELFGSVFLEADTFGDRLAHKLMFSFSDIDMKNTRDDVATSANTQSRDKWNYQATFALDAATLDVAYHKITFAIDRETQTFRARPPVFAASQLTERERDQTGYVLEYQGSLDFGLDIQASVRLDDNDAFDDFTTHVLGLSYTFPNQSTRLHFSNSSGVETPTLFEQFGFIPGSFDPNPNLKAEESSGWDIGIEQQFLDGRAVIDVTYFEEELENEITTIFPAPTFVATPVNRTGTSKRRGIEVEAQWAVTDRLDMGLTFTSLDAKEPEGREVRRPREELGISASYLFTNNRTRLSGNLRHVSNLEDLNFLGPFPVDSTRRVDLDDYSVVDLALRHDFNDRIYMTGAVNNLFDEHYEELHGYATEGTAVYIGLGMAY